MRAPHLPHAKHTNQPIFSSHPVKIEEPSFIFKNPSLNVFFSLLNIAPLFSFVLTHDQISLNKQKTNSIQYHILQLSLNGSFHQKGNLLHRNTEIYQTYMCIVKEFLKIKIT